MEKFGFCGARTASPFLDGCGSQPALFMCNNLTTGKNRMIVLLLILCLLLTGCGTGAAGQGEQAGNGSQETADSRQRDLSASPSGASESGEEASQKETDSRSEAGGSLQFLSDRQMSCMTPEGYYYITADTSEVNKDLWGRHIMYMDFATKKEVYLCNEPGCKHKDKNCTSVLPEEEFGDDCLLFVMADRLWLVSKDQDRENQISSNIVISEDGTSAEEPQLPTVIYSMNRDGSDRKKEYTFDQDVTVDNVVLSDGENMYLASKKINAVSDKQSLWHTATKRELVRFRTKDSKLDTVCSLQPDDKIRWYVAGCCDGKVILRGTQYNRNLSPQEEMELGQEEYWEYTNDSSEVYARLDLADGSVKKIYSIKNDPESENSMMLLGDFLYVSQEKAGTIQKVDLKTGKAKKLAKLKQNFIGNIMSDKLCCRAWDQTKPEYYFVDINTGEISHCTLVNQRNGWDLEIKGDTEDQVLVVYDYDAKELEEGAWDISRYQYGLIDKKDLYVSKDNFQKIDMKEAGL